MIVQMSDSTLETPLLSMNEIEDAVNLRRTEITQKYNVYADRNFIIERVLNSVISVLYAETYRKAREELLKETEI